MAAVNVKSSKKENDALKVQIENLTASMQKLEENLRRREAVSAGNGDKIEDETRKHVEFYSKSYDDLTKFKSEMINELKLYKSQLNVIAGQVESISTAIEESLRYSYQYNVKLIGIPEMNQNESATETTNICCNLFNKIGVKVNESDIDIAHRVPGRNAKPGPKPIICKLVRRLTKEHIMKVRKNVSELKASDIVLPTDSALRHALILDHLTQKYNHCLVKQRKFKLVMNISFAG